VRKRDFENISNFDGIVSLTLTSDRATWYTVV